MGDRAPVGSGNDGPGDGLTDEDVTGGDPRAEAPSTVAISVDAVAAELAAVSRRAALLGPVFGVLAVLLVPWTVYLALTLPRHHIARHYDVAWAGFDVGLVLALAWTAHTCFRRSRWLPIAASVNAAMLVVDAWFDIVTAADAAERWAALASAGLLELPLAAACLWLARNGQRIIDRQLTLQLIRRASRHEDRHADQHEDRHANRHADQHEDSHEDRRPHRRPGL